MVRDVVERRGAEFGDGRRGVVPDGFGGVFGGLRPFGHIEVRPRAQTISHLLVNLGLVRSYIAFKIAYGEVKVRNDQIIDFLDGRTCVVGEFGRGLGDDRHARLVG